jgi:U5 small nuclear ribonucleoprotein component
LFAPELGNVVFASPTYGFSFTLQSFALKCVFARLLQRCIPSCFFCRYLRAAKSEKTDHVLFASKLWGDSYFNASSRTFQQRPPVSDASRSFVEFILEPMYKIITCVLGEAAADVKHTLAQVKVFLKSSFYSRHAKFWLRITLITAFFETSSGFVDAVVQRLPSPISGT